MDKRGQISLEIVIMVLIVINIFAYITLPLAHVGRVAARNTGASALAAEGVDAIANEANMVGLGGDGARGSVEIFVSRDFTDLSCNSNFVSLTFKKYNTTNVGNPSGFGVRELIGDLENVTYPKTDSPKNTDFDLDCSNLTTDLVFDDSKACVFLNNVAGVVKIVACNRPAGGCGTACPSS